jgi:hypothetical protein
MNICSFSFDNFKGQQFRLFFLQFFCADDRFALGMMQDNFYLYPMLDFLVFLCVAF